MVRDEFPRSNKPAWTSAAREENQAVTGKKKFAADPACCSQVFSSDILYNSANIIERRRPPYNAQVSARLRRRSVELSFSDAEQPGAHFFVRHGPRISVGRGHGSTERLSLR